MRRGKKIGYEDEGSDWQRQAKTDLSEVPRCECGARLSRDRKIVWTLYGYAHQDCIERRFRPQERQAETAETWQQGEMFPSLDQDAPKTS